MTKQYLISFKRQKTRLKLLAGSKQHKDPADLKNKKQNKTRKTDSTFGMEESIWNWNSRANLGDWIEWTENYWTLTEV